MDNVLRPGSLLMSEIDRDRYLAALLKIERAIADPAITRDTIAKFVDEAVYPDGKKPWTSS